MSLLNSLHLLACFMFGLVFCLPAPVWSAGGDVSWQYDHAAVGMQEAKASVVDSQGTWWWSVIPWEAATIIWW